MQQLITPNPNIECAPGWCLQYVREAYGLPARYASATEAWNSSPSQHTGRDFPPGCWTPVWYAVAGEPLGHVVLLAPDGSVYSTSDLSTTPHHHPDLADLENYYARYGMALTYRGWTEDVGGYPVLSGGTLNTEATTITPLEDDMGILDEPIIRTGGGPLDGKPTTLRSIIAYADANTHYTREAIKATVAATVTALLTTQIARAGGATGSTDLYATLAYLDANLNKLDARDITDPAAISAAVTDATTAALKDLTITLTNAPGGGA